MISSTRSAVRIPSPVVAYSRKMTCPDCSPPSAAFLSLAFPRGHTCRQTGVRTSAIPCAASAFSSPRFDITVATTIGTPFPSQFANKRSIAPPQMRRTASPSTTLPLCETNIARSASPSNATPISACRCKHLLLEASSGIKGPRNSKSMFRPSGEQPMVCTVAPRDSSSRRRQRERRLRCRNRPRPKAGKGGAKSGEKMIR